jgi:hypothetical protein
LFLSTRGTWVAAGFRNSEKNNSWLIKAVLSVLRIALGKTASFLLKSSEWRSSGNAALRSFPQLQGCLPFRLAQRQEGELAKAARQRL